VQPVIFAQQEISQPPQSSPPRLPVKRVTIAEKIKQTEVSFASVRFRMMFSSMVMQVAGVMGMVMCFLGFLLTSPATDFLVRKISEAHGRNPSDMFALKFNMYNIVRDFCLVAFVAFGIVYAMGKMTMKAVKK